MPGHARGKIEGVMVTKVDANSPAWLHGLRPGDIIVGVNRKKVRSVQEFLAALQASQDRHHAQSVAWRFQADDRRSV